MYIVFGDEIVDSNEIKLLIENNSNFVVNKDMTKGTKREDTIAFQISIKIDELNSFIKENYGLEDIDKEYIFSEYMTITDELAMDLEHLFSEDIIINARAYKLDNSEDDIKAILVISHKELGNLKLLDITKRLLTQLDWFKLSVYFNLAIQLKNLK